MAQNTTTCWPLSCEEYYLILIEDAEIETGTYGTQITINGKAK